MLTREQADAELARRAAERDRVTAGLLELDTHTARRLLDGATLAGRTSTHWAAAHKDLAALWSHFDAYSAVLRQAEELRAGSRRPGTVELAQLTELLTGQSVILTPDMPSFADRTLTGPTTTRITLDGAVTAMSAAYDRVKSVVVAVDDAWTLLMPRLESITTDLREARAGVGTLGLDGPLVADLTEREAEAEGVRQGIAADPLGFPADRLDRLAAAVTPLKQRVAAAVRLRAEFTERAVRLRAAIAEVATAEAETARARETTLAKIAASAVPPATTAARPLGRRLAEIEAAGTARLDAADRVERLERDTATALAAARARLAAVTAPLEARGELRGRLDAYRARARASGLAEDPALAECYQTARDLLWTAPCDVVAAARAVRDYQDAVIAATAARRG